MKFYKYMAKIYKTARGFGKDYMFRIKLLKRMTLRMYGIGYLIATPKVRLVLLHDTMNFINMLSYAYNHMFDNMVFL